MEQATVLGPLQFRFESVEHRVVPPFEGHALARFEDGAEARIVLEPARCYLVIDHRGDPGRRARVEFWRTDTATELPLEGLYILCDAVEIPTAAPGRTA